VHTYGYIYFSELRVLTFKGQQELFKIKFQNNFPPKMSPELEREVSLLVYSQVKAAAIKGYCHEKKMVMLKSTGENY
jgi:hypothetical protein